MRKGQFLIAGMLLFGLLLLTLGFSTLEFESPSETRYTFSGIEESVRKAAERFSDYRGRDFMEAYHFYSIKQRQNINLAGNSLEMTVVAGFQEGQQMKVYTGNFRGSNQHVNVTVNGDNITNKISGDRIVENSTEVSDSYTVEVYGEHSSSGFKDSGDSFLLVAYRYVSENSVRQNTYTS